MFTLTVPSLPVWEYLHSFTWFMGPVMMVGCAVLLAYPSQRRKIAFFWSAIGLFQVLFSGFYSYPYSVFVTFPNEVTFGLFVLTCGIVLFTFDAAKKKRKSIWASLFFVILGFAELFFFGDFSRKFSDFTIWNIWVNATPYYAFLAAGITTICCGNINLVLGRSKKQ
jgi:hypothetical protein